MKNATTEDRAIGIGQKSIQIGALDRVIDTGRKIIGVRIWVGPRGRARVKPACVDFSGRVILKYPDADHLCEWRRNAGVDPRTYTWMWERAGFIPQGDAVVDMIVQTMVSAALAKMRQEFMVSP